MRGESFAVSYPRTIKIITDIPNMVFVIKQSTSLSDSILLRTVSISRLPITNFFTTESIKYTWAIISYSLAVKLKHSQDGPDDKLVLKKIVIILFYSGLVLLLSLPFHILWLHFIPQIVISLIHIRRGLQINCIA